MSKRPLLCFFLLTFGISWGVPGLALLLATLTGAFEPNLSEFSPLSYVVLWAPATAALLVIAASGGWPGIGAYLRRLGRPTGHWGWYAAVALGIPLLNLGAALGMEAIGQDAITGTGMTVGTLVTLSLLRLTEGPMEELGWRGFALPLLQRRMSGLTASTVLGGIWALWHVPAFVIGRSVGGGIDGSIVYVLILFFLTLIAQSVLLTVVYNATRGSVLIAVFFHWMINLPYAWETGIDLSPVAGPIWILAALIVGGSVGRRYLGRSHQHTDVAPGLFPENGRQKNSLPESDSLSSFLSS